MRYSTYADAVAKEVRQQWNKDWDAATIGKRTFQHQTHSTLCPRERTIYCIAQRGGFFQSTPFTVTDRTSALIVRCETIEEARVEFARVQKQMIADGWGAA